MRSSDAAFDLEADLAAADPEVAALIGREVERNRSALNLIASESYCPRATLEAEASILVTKNATGYPGSREVAGCEVFDQVETLAIERAKRLFGAEHANVQSVAATLANIAVLRALLKPRRSHPRSRRDGGRPSQPRRALPRLRPGLRGHAFWRERGGGRDRRRRAYGLSPSGFGRVS